MFIRLLTHSHYRQIVKYGIGKTYATSVTPAISVYDNSMYLAYAGWLKYVIKFYRGYKLTAVGNKSAQQITVETKLHDIHTAMTEVAMLSMSEQKLYVIMNNSTYHST